MDRLLSLILLHFAVVAAAQTDTIRIQQYNLLNYGNAANPTSYKDPRLATILQHVQPDILGVNEIRDDPTLLDHLRDSVLGPGWVHGSYHNSTGQTQFSGLLWKSSLFTLRSSALITAQVRDIVAYELRYNDTISTPHDTAFLTVIVAHLKAGNSAENDFIRADEAASIASYLHFYKPRSYILQGDLNFYSSNNTGYQLLVNHPAYGAQLMDPIARPGNWHEDASFADIHTQSPRATTIGDGGVAGGLDDRFDQILTIASLLQDTAQIHALPATYRTIGQDGQHFNGSLLDLPENTAAPAAVIQTLYEMSDHLPVAMDIVVSVKPTASTQIAGFRKLESEWINIENPVDGIMHLHGAEPGQQVHVKVFDLSGRLVFRQDVTADGQGKCSVWSVGISGQHLVEITAGHISVRHVIVFQ